MGLSAKLDAYKAKYADSYHTFDCEHIACRVQRSVDKYYFSAFTYCDSPHEGGFDMSDIISFYQSRSCLSEEEAQALLVKEVRSAAKAHVHTHFYRIHTKDTDEEEFQEYQSGKWVSTQWNGWNCV